MAEPFQPISYDPHGRILLTFAGRCIAQQVDRLWPGQTMDERGMALAEEAGEVNRALLKRNHVRKYGGTFKGKGEAEWTDNLRTELAQLIGVALDIAHREGFDMAEAIVDVLNALEAMPSTASNTRDEAAPAASKASPDA